MWRRRDPLAAGAVRPALSPRAFRRSPKSRPSGPHWVHEIKHDGYRIIARKDRERVRLWSRHGLSWTAAFPLIVEALRAMPAECVVLDGEAVLECEDARHDFHGLRTKAAKNACLFAFDLLALDGADLRPAPLEERRKRLAALLAGAHPGLRLSEALEGDGALILRHACVLGLEGIVSKRRDAPYRSGRSRTWLKVKCEHYHRPR